MAITASAPTDTIPFSFREHFISHCDNRVASLHCLAYGAIH
jgi:hypothetical protein